jgi:hypothetical protein
MAKPIKITPVLRNNDAANFYKTLELNKSSKVSADRILEIKKAAKEFRAIRKQ